MVANSFYHMPTVVNPGPMASVAFELLAGVWRRVQREACRVVVGAGGGCGEEGKPTPCPPSSAAQIMRRSPLEVVVTPLQQSLFSSVSSILIVFFFFFLFNSLFTFCTTPFQPLPRHVQPFPLTFLWDSITLYICFLFSFFLLPFKWGAL